MTIMTLHMSFTDFAYEFDRLVHMLYIFFIFVGCGNVEQYVHSNGYDSYLCLQDDRSGT